MTAGERVAAAAQGLIGTRFRLHGRGADGLDCIGLAAAALAGAGIRAEPPRDYPLRGGGRERIEAALAALGLVAGAGERVGDIVLAQPGPAQLHLAVRTARGFVHADAGLRRVVERPGDPEWPLLGRWRIEEE